MSERRVLAEGRHVRLVSEDGWEFVERPSASGIAVIVAVTPDDRLLLVEQFRPPVRCRVIELPAGLAGDLAGHEAEPLAEAARRELLEETGYSAEAMLPVRAGGPPSAGVSSEIVSFFRALGLRRVAAGGGDGSEAIVVHEVALAELESWLSEQTDRGLLVDPKVYAGLYFLTRS